MQVSVSHEATESQIQVSGMSRQIMMEAVALSRMVGRPVQIIDGSENALLVFDVIPGRVSIVEHVGFKIRPFAVLDCSGEPTAEMYATIQEAVDAAVALVSGRGRVHVAPSLFDEETEQVVNVVTADHPDSKGLWTTQALEGAATLEAKLDAAAFLALMEGIHSTKPVELYELFELLEAA